MSSLVAFAAVVSDSRRQQELEVRVDLLFEVAALFNEGERFGSCAQSDAFSQIWIAGKEFQAVLPRLAGGGNVAVLGQGVAQPHRSPDEIRPRVRCTTPFALQVDALAEILGG